MSSAERKAEDFILQAEKALKRFSIFSSASKFEDASDCYEKAGNQYKIAKKWQDAGEAYAKAAECQIKLKESSRAAQFYQTAGEAFQKVNPQDAITHLREAISMLCDAGRFSTAAKIQKKVGEIYEEENNKEEAIESYKIAAEYFEGENQTSSANSVMLKVAQFSAELKRYAAAAEIFESIARTSMESNLLKFNAKGHLLNAGICVLATLDRVLVSQKVEEYSEIDFSFADSREGKMFADVAAAFEEYDADAFADAVYQYDSISKLDGWKISALLEVKNSLTENAEEAVSLT